MRTAVSAQAHLREAQVKPRSGAPELKPTRESLGIAGRPAAARTDAAKE